MQVEHGECYSFELPDDCLNEEETQDVIAQLLIDLRKTPVGKSFVLDIAIGPEKRPNQPWHEFVATRVKFMRAEYERSQDIITEADVIDFLREHFDEMLTLPRPRLRRIK